MHVFLEKARLESLGTYFSRKRLDWKAGARISRERGYTGKLVYVFLEKKARLEAGPVRPA